MREKEADRIIEKHDRYVNEQVKDKYKHVQTMGDGRGITFEVFISRENGDILLVTSFIYYNLMLGDSMVKPVELMIEVTERESGFKVDKRYDIIEQLTSNEVIMDAIELIMRAGELVLRGCIGEDTPYEIGHTGSINYVNCRDQFKFGILSSSDTGCDTTQIKDSAQCKFYYIVELDEDTYTDLVARDTKVEENIEAFKEALRKRKEK